MDAAFKARVDEMLQKNKVLLFVKGTKSFPQCGFSNAVINIFKEIPNATSRQRRQWPQMLARPSTRIDAHKHTHVLPVLTQAAVVWFAHAPGATFEQRRHTHV